MQSFAQRIGQNGDGFRKRKIDVLQINMGKYCNQACLHCHIEAGPGRKDLMTRETVNAILRFLERSEILTVNITGRAPELTPSFDYLPVISKQERPPKIWELSANAVESQPIQVGNHCYTCTAGAGSSCGGALIS